MDHRHAMRAWAPAALLHLTGLIQKLRVSVWKPLEHFCITVPSKHAIVFLVIDFIIFYKSGGL